MTTQVCILLDHLVALLSVAAWFAAGAALALRRARLALAALAVAVLVTLLRVVTVVVLAGRGWWFVQEKLLLGLPMVGVAGIAALLLAAARGRGDGGPARAVVSVFTAAYAALAGLVVIVLAGYPLTPGTAVLTVSPVAGGGLLTASVVAPASGNTAGGGAAEAPQGRRRISRRRFVGWAGGAVVTVGAGATIGLSFTAREPVTTGGGPAGSPRTAVSVADLRGPASPAPGGTVRRHVLTARKATLRLPSGRTSQAWTYNGQVPGPAITAVQGDLIDVRLRNADIDDGVTLHWHGYDVPCGEDGAPGVTQPARPAPAGGAGGPDPAPAHRRRRPDDRRTRRPRRARGLARRMRTASPGQHRLEPAPDRPRRDPVPGGGRGRT